jgi:hypothetical protein
MPLPSTLVSPTYLVNSYPVKSPSTLSTISSYPLVADSCRESVFDNPFTVLSYSSTLLLFQLSHSTRSGQLPRVCLRQPLHCIVLFNVAVDFTFSSHSFRTATASLSSTPLPSPVSQHAFIYARLLRPLFHEIRVPRHRYVVEGYFSRFRISAYHQSHVTALIR